MIYVCICLSNLEPFSKVINFFIIIFLDLQKAFDMYEDPQRVMEVVKTNLRAEDAPVPEYLVSRSVAGN